MISAHGSLGTGLYVPRPPVSALPAGLLLQHQQPCKFRTSPVTHATRDVNFAYQQDIQTKLKPGDFADRMDNKGGHVAGAADWREVVRLFVELGENTDRNIGLVGDMLVQLQRLAPAAAAAGDLPAQDARLLAMGISNICAVLLDNITRVNNKLLTNVVWALALLPDPAKLVKSPSTAAARMRAVAGFGAAVITRMPKLTAEEVFHVAAALALLGFKPPRTLTRERSPKPGAEQGSNPGPSASMKFGTLLEKRSIKVMNYLTPKTIADAGFVVSRLVAPGDISTEWLDLYQKISKQHLPTMQPEAVVYAGYALARHGLKPSNSWQKAYIAAVQGIATTLTGEEFPMVLFTLARWQQQRQQQQLPEADFASNSDDKEDSDQQWSAGGGVGSSSSSSSVQGLGPVVPQTLVDDLLFASHTNRALRDLPLGQVVIMVKAVTELPVSAHPLWMQRLWPLINTKIDAAVASAGSTAAAAAAAATTGSTSSTAAAAAAADLAPDLAALLTTIPRLNPSPTLPPDFVEGLVGNLGLGLQQLNANELSGVWGALRQLKHTPDIIFQRQLQAAVLQAVPNAAAKDLAVLLQLGLAAGLSPRSSSSSSSSSNVQGLLTADAFCQQLLDGLVRAVQRQVNLAAGQNNAAAAAGRPAAAAGRPAAAAAAAAGLAALQEQQRQQLLENSAATGLWQLPQTLLACAHALDAAAAAAAATQSDSSSTAAAAAAAVLEKAVPALQQLWLDSTVRLASVMPTEPLLVALGFVVDLTEEDLLALGLVGGSSSSSKTATIAAILQAAVYQHLGTSAPATTSRGSAGVTSRSGYTKNLLANFSSEDFTELLIIISDAGLAASAPQGLLDSAAEALHGALEPKGPAYGFAVSAAIAEDLVRELVSSFDYRLPAKVKARYKKWLEVSGLTVPEALLMRRKGSSSGGGSDGGKNMQGKVAAAAAAVKTSPAAAAAVEIPPPAAAAAPPPAPAVPVVEGGVVRSSRRTTQ